MYISLVITWVLFIGLFPVSFFWIRRAWKIIFNKDYSYVALKRGKPPVNAEKYAPFSAGINMIAGVVFAGVILCIVIGGLEYNKWTAIIGTTIWFKIFADFILSRHAHMIERNKY